MEGRRKNESEPSIRFLSRPWATRFVNKATFGDLAVNWSVALRKTDSGVEGRLTFLGHNPVWLVWQISPEFHDKTRGTSRSLYRKVMVTGPQNSAECHIIVEVSGEKKKNPKQREVESLSPSSDASSLLPEWAFVLQFCGSAHSSSLSSAGRGEHIISGQSTPFSGPNDLFEFFRRKLTEQYQACRRTVGGIHHEEVGGTHFLCRLPTRRSTPCLRVFQ